MRPHKLRDRVGLLHHLPRGRQDGLAHRCHHHRAVVALEYRDAQFFLELFDLTAQGGLADEAPLRRATEVLCVRHGDDVFQISKIHAETQGMFGGHNSTIDIAINHGGVMRPQRKFRHLLRTELN